MASNKQFEPPSVAVSTTYATEDVPLPWPHSARGPCAPSPAAACLLDEVLTAVPGTSYDFASLAARTARASEHDFVVGPRPRTQIRAGVRRFCSVEDLIGSERDT